MDISQIEKLSETAWQIQAVEPMGVPAIIYGGESLVRDMDEKVAEQLKNVAALPGIVRAAYAMPDAHWGYGFPVGGVAAFDADDDGVVSAGGVGFDVSCGVRTNLTGLRRGKIASVQSKLADALYREIPAGLGSHSAMTLDDAEMSDMLSRGAHWAVERGLGRSEDLERIEEHGCAIGGDPAAVSDNARKRQRREMGTLGSGNHYLEVQEVAEIFDEEAASAFGLKKGECVISIHCGSRGGHQIGSEFMREMAAAAETSGWPLPDRELAYAPIKSDLGQRYLGAMRCALANREIIGNLTRRVFAQIFEHAELPLLFDVSHNTCKVEPCLIDGDSRQLYIHRKGATRAFGPGHPSLPEDLRSFGQPVLIGGSMGTSSYVLTGAAGNEALSFSSACHGAGRQISRHQALKNWSGRQIIDELKEHGIIVKSPSQRGVAEEAPGAYKDVGAVVEATEAAGLAIKVARLA
ncbi:MAG TPA: RtcB family protein, partial [Rhodomicrobium sp.]|nr:RtcB family protein [Rhodomicrobium sp.]